MTHEPVPFRHPSVRPADRPARAARGFTLVEIAVVLVIIGLLLGGVLKGQELINSAKAKSLISDYRTVSTHLYGYQDRFRAVPGDDAGAAARLPGGTVATSGGTPGNGRIESAWNSLTATDESVLFWQHVRLANLAGGDARDPGAAGVVLADWLPRNAEGGRIGVTGIAPVANWGGSYFVCQDNIGGRFARQIDATMDDGMPDTGSVRVLANGAAQGAAIAAANLQDGTPYTVCAAF